MVARIYDTTEALCFCTSSTRASTRVAAAGTSSVPACSRKYAHSSVYPPTAAAAAEKAPCPCGANTMGTPDARSQRAVPSLLRICARTSTTREPVQRYTRALITCVCVPAPYPCPRSPRSLAPLAPLAPLALALALALSLSFSRSLARPPPPFRESGILFAGAIQSRARTAAAPPCASTSTNRKSSVNRRSSSLARRQYPHHSAPNITNRSPRVGETYFSVSLG